MGIWTTVRTLLEYGNYSSLGVGRAAGVELAIAAGREDRSGLRRFANVAMTVELAAAGVVALLMFTAGSALALDRGSTWLAAFLSGAGLALLSRYYAFSLTALRSLKSFGTLARSRVFGGFVELTLFCAGTYWFGFAGLLGAAVLAQLAGVWYVRWDGGLRFQPEYDRGMAWSLMAQGCPMAVEALALSALRSVDRFVIVRCLENGEEQLGWYKIAIVMGAWAFDQSNLVANVVFPRLGEALGRTNDVSNVMRLGLRTAEVIALVMAFCVAALLVAGVPLASWLLPAYRPGLSAAGGLVVAAAMLGVSMPLRHALLTVKRVRSMLAVTVMCAVIALAGASWILHGSKDIEGGRLALVSWASAGSAGLLLGITLGLASVRHRELWGQACRVAMIAAYVAAGGAMIPHLLSDLRVAALVAMVWSGIPVWLLLRQIDWRSLLRRAG
jgi:O-antigen/teichoic acid export membrane protein